MICFPWCVRKTDDATVENAPPSNGSGSPPSSSVKSVQPTEPAEVLEESSETPKITITVPSREALPLASAHGKQTRRLGSPSRTTRPATPSTPSTPASPDSPSSAGSPVLPPLDGGLAKLGSLKQVEEEVADKTQSRPVEEAEPPAASGASKEPGPVEEAEVSKAVSQMEVVEPPTPTEEVSVAKEAQPSTAEEAEPSKAASSVEAAELHMPSKTAGPVDEAKPATVTSVEPPVPETKPTPAQLHTNSPSADEVTSEHDSSPEDITPATEQFAVTDPSSVQDPPAQDSKPTPEQFATSEVDATEDGAESKTEVKPTVYVSPAPVVPKAVYGGNAEYIEFVPVERAATPKALRSEYDPDRTPRASISSMLMTASKPEPEVATLPEPEVILDKGKGKQKEIDAPAAS